MTPITRVAPSPPASDQGGTTAVQPLGMGEDGRGDGAQGGARQSAEGGQQQ